MTPEKVLSIFREITKIPRESGHEEPMTEFLIEFAKSHNLPYKKDETGNVLICKPASKGKENVPVLVFQAHQDMVCEKNPGCIHDFSKDPIDYVIEDGWMIAKDTTLGADDGIGIAACLALLESNLEMGPVECLFTINEETGLVGAFGIEEGFFSGKTLINLDSEEEGEFCIGCAGGVDTITDFKFAAEDVPEGWVFRKIHFYGAQGGHSGEDINKNRCNAVLMMARFLNAHKGEYMLCDIKGGNKSNAIARDCEAVVALPGDGKAFLESFAEFGKTVSSEYATSDPEVSVEFCDAAEAKAIEKNVADNVVAAMVAVHHGVLSMSQDIPGLVETSSNLASVKIVSNDIIRIETSQRSSVDSAKEFLVQKINTTFALAGGVSSQICPYPGWKPNVNSKILEIAVSSYESLFGRKPIVKAIHAGLECGLFLEKFHGLDMISFGPTLQGVHAPGEKLDIASNERFVELLADIVVNFK